MKCPVCADKSSSQAATAVNGRRKIWSKDDNDVEDLEMGCLQKASVGEMQVGDLVPLSTLCRVERKRASG